ncbi:unnamed protein product [Rhizopus microsporus]
MTIIWKKIQSANNHIYQFVFPDSEFCTPFYCDFANTAYDGHLVAIGDEEGRVSLLRTDKDNSINNSQFHHSFYCHKHAISDVKWSADDSLLLTASHDRLVRLWDTETRSTLADFAGHDDIIKSVNWHPTNQHLIITGSKDGSFRIWDTRFNQKPGTDSADSPDIPIYSPIKTTMNAHDINQGSRSTKKSGLKPLVIRSVTSAIFINNHEEKVITSGSVDGTIKLWDVRAGRSSQVLESTEFKNEAGKRHGITDLKVDSSGTRLFSSCMDNSIYMHYLTDLTKPAIKYTDEEFKLGSFDIRISISPDDQFIMAGSYDKDIFVWEINGNQKKAHKFEGHTRKVTGVAWNKYSMKQFVSCSEDFTARIWNLDYSLTE